MDTRIVGAAAFGFLLRPHDRPKWRRLADRPVSPEQPSGFGAGSGLSVFRYFFAIAALSRLIERNRFSAPIRSLRAGRCAQSQSRISLPLPHTHSQCPLGSPPVSVLR